MVSGVRIARHWSLLRDYVAALLQKSRIRVVSRGSPRAGGLQLEVVRRMRVPHRHRLDFGVEFAVGVVSGQGHSGDGVTMVMGHCLRRTVLLRMVEECWSLYAQS